MEWLFMGAVRRRWFRCSAALSVAAVLFAAPMAFTAASAATLSLGVAHACTVTYSGGVKCWGNNDFFSLGDGTQNPSESPVDVLGLDATVSDVAAGGYFSCVLTTSGGVKCWGHGLNGTLGASSNWLSGRPLDVKGLETGVKAIATGARHACALTAAGGVRCWGSNYRGALGDGTEVDSPIPVNVRGLDSDVVAIEAGYDYSCALTSAGAAKCWGENDSGQLGDGTYIDRAIPVGVKGLSAGVTAIATSAGHTCAIVVGGRVKCWGSNGSGALGDGSQISSPIPVDAISLREPATAIVAGFWHTCALTRAGAVKCWGMNASGMLGDGTTESRMNAKAVVGLGSGVVGLAAGFDHTCARLLAGELRCWGSGDSGKLGNGVPVRRLTAVEVSGLGLDVAAISAAEHHACALNAKGGVACWGSNQSGELGDGTNRPHPRPIAVKGLDSGVKTVATAGAFSCAVTLGNQALCWGWNGRGQLGDGTFTSHAAPLPVARQANITTIALGGVHVCGVRVNGSVACWGDGSVGQLGNGGTESSLVPATVTGLSADVRAVAAGIFHTCALTNAGGVKCWGQNGHGELGDGTTSNRLVPTDVIGLGASVVAIAAGETHTCALLESAAVKCWGNDRLTPGDVLGLDSPVTAITAGGGHDCALTSAGGVKCWGGNYYGQLGDGTVVSSESPVDVLGLRSGVAMIAAGRTSTCAVTDEGSAWCWGSNLDGQLGNGEAGYALTPQAVVDWPFGMPPGHMVRLPPVMPPHRR